MSNARQLNLIDILNSKLKHSQKTNATDNTIKIPRVHHGHMNDGVHDLTFGYANTNRVFHELVSNSFKAISEVKHKTQLGSLSDYITTDDSVSSSTDNKLVLGKNGVISDNKFLRFSEQSAGILSINEPIVDIFIADENQCVFLTKTKIYSYDAATYNTEKLFEITEDNNEILSTKLLDDFKFQIVTYHGIKHFKLIWNIDDKQKTIDIQETLSVDFHQLHDDKNLLIIDVVRKKAIKTIIENNEQIIWFNDFIPLATSTFATNANTNLVSMQCLGILTGPYGIFELIEHSNGFHFIRVIDNDYVTCSMKYKKDNSEWIVVFNKIGVKTYKLLYDGIRQFSLDFTNAPEFDNDVWQWLPESGTIETYPNSGYYVNINDILEYSITPDTNLSEEEYLSQRIPGASAGDIKYTYYIDSVDNKMIAIYDVFEIDGEVNGFRCVFSPSTTGMIRLVNDYDLHEFNGLKEVSVKQIKKFNDSSDDNCLFNIENIGIVKGERIKSNSSNTTGFRLSNIYKHNSENQTSNCVLFETGNCVFIFNPTTDTVYATAIDSDDVLEISTLFSPIAVTRPINDYVFIADSSKNTIYKSKLIRHYATTTTDIVNIITDLIIKNTNSELNNLFKRSHIDIMHTDNSAMTRLNKFIYDLQMRSTADSTRFISDSKYAYISTGYSLKGIEQKVTDKNSTNIYGRIKSRTCDSNLQFTTQTKRTTDSVLFYDTVLSDNGVETSLNKLSYTATKIADNIVQLDINVPTTFTYYVNNILGWSKGANTGSVLNRDNLSGGFLSGRIENVSTDYQLVLNRNYFNIERIININCQLASAPLGIYSDKTNFDATHFGMFDSPIVTPLCTSKLLTDNTYEIQDNSNNEIVLSFNVFGGDALTISLLIETNDNR